MCYSTKCSVCGKPAKSCSLVQGMHPYCKNNQTKIVVAPNPTPGLNQVTPPNNYSDVYHTN